MKNKEYKGAANILNNQNIGKQFFDHMDFGDCLRLWGYFRHYQDNK
jgi:hypothetical protein